MNSYEILLDCATDAGCVVKEIDFEAYDGLVKGNRIGIRKSIPTYMQKASVLCEELSHYLVNVGNILNQDDSNNRKQEHTARSLAHDILIGLDGIIRAYENECANLYEMSVFLDVPEEFIEEALTYYRRKYGEYVDMDNYRIYFEPSLMVQKIDFLS